MRALAFVLVLAEALASGCEREPDSRGDSNVVSRPALGESASAASNDPSRLGQPTATRVLAIPNEKDFARCIGALQHAALSKLPTSTLVERGPGGEGPLSLLPMFRSAVLPVAEDRGQPVTRRHLMLWMPGADRLALAHLTGRQMAILLEPYVRWRRELVTDLATVLFPGGVSPFWEPDGGEAVLVAVGQWTRHSPPLPKNARALEPHETYPVWIPASLAETPNDLSRRALLHPSQLEDEAGIPLRELVFAYLSAAGRGLPRECAGWLAR